MKSSSLLFFIILLGTSCNSHSRLDSANEAQVQDGARSHQAIAREIYSIQLEFKAALLNLGKTNAQVFAAEVERLADRLDIVSRDLDRQGAFSSSLREATLKKIDDSDKSFAALAEKRIQVGALQDDDAKIVSPAVTRYFDIWASVSDKAGLVIPAQGASGKRNNKGSDLRGLRGASPEGTNQPPPTNPPADGKR